MNEPSKKAIGVRIRYVNIILICLAFVAAIVLIRSTMQTLIAYQNLQDDTGRYLRGQEDAAAMQEASDYLSRQVLLFAVTGDQAHVDLYFDEVNVIRRRENAIDNLRAIAVDRDSVDSLEAALRLSIELMQLEYRSMRLVYAAGGDARGDMPDPVADIELTAEELALSPDEKMHLAAQMVTNGDYQAYKDAISENVRLCA